jgi:hypothetical protein
MRLRGKATAVIIAGLATIALAGACSAGTASQTKPAPIAQTSFPDDERNQISSIQVGHSAQVPGNFMLVDISTLGCYIAKNFWFATPQRRHSHPNSYEESTLVTVTHEADGYYVSHNLSPTIKWMGQRLDTSGPDLVPVRNCGNLDQPLTGLRPTPNRLQNAYRILSVWHDLKARGSGWVPEETIKPDAAPQEMGDGGLSTINPVVLVPDSRTGCRIDPLNPLSPQGDPTKGDVKVGWNGSQYTILSPHSANGSIIARWDTKAKDGDFYHTKQWWPAVCPPR